MTNARRAKLADFATNDGRKAARRAFSWKKPRSARPKRTTPPRRGFAGWAETQSYINDERDALEDAWNAGWYEALIDLGEW